MLSFKNEKRKRRNQIQISIEMKISISPKFDHDSFFKSFQCVVNVGTSTTSCTTRCTTSFVIDFQGTAARGASKVPSITIKMTRGVEKETSVTPSTMRH